MHTHSPCSRRTGADASTAPGARTVHLLSHLPTNGVPAPGAAPVPCARVSDGYQRFAQFPLPARQDGVYRMTPGQTFLMTPQLQDLTPFTLSKAKCARISGDDSA